MRINCLHAPLSSAPLQGFLVVVPDYFKGNPRTTNSTPASFPTW